MTANKNALLIIDIGGKDWISLKAGYNSPLMD